MGGGETVDGIALGVGFLGEVEKAADVVVLVEAGEEALCFFDGKTKLRNRNRIAEGMNELAVEVRKFL